MHKSFIFPKIKIFYIALFIADGNAEGDFLLDGSTGVISVVNALSKNRTASYTLQVTAADNGTPSRTATATLSITVGDSSGGSGGSGGSDSSASAVAASICLIGIAMLASLF